jgi:hypothetical protein
MFFNPILPHVMQVAVVQVVNVPIVPDACMPATGTVLVRVPFVMSRHVIISLLRSDGSLAPTTAT